MTRTVVELDTLHAASAPRSAWISASFRSHQGVVDIFRRSCARTKVAPVFRNKSGR
jgi:hypothetical protein